MGSKIDQLDLAIKTKYHQYKILNKTSRHDTHDDEIIHSLKRVSLFITSSRSSYFSDDGSEYTFLCNHYDPINHLNQVARFYDEPQMSITMEPLPHRTPIENELLDKYDISSDTHIRGNKLYLKYFRRQLLRCEASTAVIPQSIIDKIPPQPSIALTIAAIRDANLSRYVNDSAYIYYRTNKKKPPSFQGTERDDLTNTFKRLLSNHLAIYPGKSVSYRYVLYRLILHHLDDTPRRLGILSSITLPARRTILRLDKVWKKVVADLDDMDSGPFKLLKE